MKYTLVSTACIRAYNDHQIDEFAKPFPSRFITLAQVPMWDVQRAVAGARRMAERGVKGITFAFPHPARIPAHQRPALGPALGVRPGSQPVGQLPHRQRSQHGIALESLSQSAPSFANAEGSTKAVAANVQVMTVLLFSGIEAAGLEMMRDHVSLDNVMFGSDFPHPTGTWPSARACVERSLEGLTAEERRKVTVDNAIRVFDL